MDVIDRLTTALNTGDLNALVACFATGYRNETPVHPSRDFIGSDQVRRNWQQIFAAVSGLTAAVIRRVEDSGTIWVEWDWTGVKPDASRFAMRGVTILGIDEDRIQWARFYMEPVDTEPIDVATAVRHTIGGEP